MKKSKFILGFGALLLAGAGAFATAKTYVPTQVWYEASPTSCVDTTLDIECQSGGPGCIGNNPAKESFGKQLYSDLNCDHSLQEIQL